MAVAKLRSSTMAEEAGVHRRYLAHAGVRPRVQHDRIGWIRAGLLEAASDARAADWLVVLWPRDESRSRAGIAL